MATTKEAKDATKGSTSAKPALPAKKKAGSGSGSKKQAASATALPINHAQFITLEDGSQVPVRIPPGMPAEQAEGILNFLKTNPDAAKAAWAQAQTIMKSPGLANAFINMQAQSDPAKSAEVYAALKDDPELQHVFEDVKANGPGALQKYWDDTELMSKISSKLRDMRIGAGAAPGDANNAAAGKPLAKGAGKPLSESIVSLHDAAKWGDVEAATRLLNEGNDVNGLNERGISPLGVAVGFNRAALVTLLLDAGADLDARDGGGNTVLHYAAGYGRLELTQLLLERGAALDAANAKQQKPVDVAKLNGEKHVVAFLEKQEKGEAGDEPAPAQEASS